ncbi:hypothetical protein FRACYDRAFT_247974 [Fragilariopsis cylindrus CCMP1102]|uniref:Methyltransferase domain-containing protein n=1 Tax=Fragilariopsis cylindrus CCMP1102 TaxID=635003 RepID=A0A1E7EUK4_9STRA|nr:hypothetical protein FRACYDRAFT_247974 [Fragilariopsis cylindrus CCMP1102]|eukprot:OEU09718.1 hypothetical protein FRACYDRAFT_247974 [Fragilariopsis cylindrus CCMP1102]
MIYQEKNLKKSISISSSTEKRKKKELLILGLGCGFGELSHALTHNRGHDATGIDVNEKATETARQKAACGSMQLLLSTIGDNEKRINALHFGPPNQGGSTIIISETLYLLPVQYTSIMQYNII